MSDQRPITERTPSSAGISSNLEARPKNWLMPVTLVLLRQHGSYGYDLMQQIEELGFQTINAGTLYRTLRQMEKDGLCESEWETSSEGPACRMYSITDAGEAYLELWVESLKQYQQNMDAFFQAYKSGNSGM